MTYRLHEGIVYAKVSGVHLLVATRSAWELFPPVRQLSPLQGAFICGILKDLPEDDLLEWLIFPPKMKKAAVRQRYRKFVEMMDQEGYLIPEE